MSTIVERQHDLSSLRDSFAAAALTGLLSNIQTYQLVAVTRQAYDIADEMLVQRRPRQGNVATDKAIQDAKDFARIREQFEAWQKERSVGVAEMGSATDRKSAATPRACARSCSQPFDSAPTTHDAVPEAKATNDGGTPKDADGTGNTQRPVAWARFFPNGGPMSVFLDRPPADAEPLYRSPALTDDEREAVRFFSQIDGPGNVPVANKRAATLNSLLERLA